MESISVKLHDEIDLNVKKYVKHLGNKITFTPKIEIKKAKKLEWLEEDSENLIKNAVSLISDGR
jgi:hypothetical protein